MIFQKQNGPESAATRFITHHAYDSYPKLKECVDKILKKIHDYPGTDEKKNTLFSILNELIDTPIGRYLIVNKGLNGYWYNQIAFGDWSRQKLFPIEEFIFKHSPLQLSIQECCQTIQKIISLNLIERIRIASVSCGLMSDLLTLGYPNITNFSLIGVDLDMESIALSCHLAGQKNLLSHVTYIQCDAWNLPFNNEIHLISHHGIAPYIESRSQLKALYQKMYDALYQGGGLITSFQTPPESNSRLIWPLTHKQQADLDYQDLVFHTIIGWGWKFYYTLDEMAELLEEIGFSSIQFVLDSHQIFPVVFAKK